LLKKKDTWCAYVEGDLFYDAVLGFPQEQRNKEFYSLAGAKNGRGGNKTPHCTIARLPCMKLAKAGVQDDKAALC